MKLSDFLQELAEADLDPTDPVIHHRGVLHMGIQVVLLGPNPAHNKSWRVNDFGKRTVSLQIEAYDPNDAQTRLKYENRLIYASDPAGTVLLNNAKEPNANPLDGLTRFDVKRVVIGRDKVDSSKKRKS
jgi:hypothetical protein